MAESGVGKIRLFDDFVGFDIPVAGVLTAALDPIHTPGGLKFVGQGIEVNDSGAPRLNSDGLNGVVTLTATDELEHTAGFQTAACFDMTLNGGIMIEARVRQAALTTKAVWFGLSDVVTAAGLQVLQGEIISGATATLTLSASDLCGFLMASELTATATWHAPYNGGTTTGPTASASVVLPDVATAGEWQILKLTVGNDGTARWYVDGVLRQTVTGAVSTTTDLSVLLMVEEKVTGNAALDVDYILIEAGRDWTV